MSQDTTYVQNGPADETLTRLAPCGLVCTRLRGGRNTWEGYVLSQEGPRQCRQEEGFFPGSQRLSATVLQLLVWTQSTFRDWKPWPQADVQGLQGPACQHASRAPDEQFLQKVGLKWEKQTQKWTMGESGVSLLAGIKPFTVLYFQYSKGLTIRTLFNRKLICIVPGWLSKVVEESQPQQRQANRVFPWASGTTSRHAPQKTHPTDELEQIDWGKEEKNDTFVDKL